MIEQINKWYEKNIEKEDKNVDIIDVCRGQLYKIYKIKDRLIVSMLYGVALRNQNNISHFDEFKSNLFEIKDFLGNFLFEWIILTKKLKLIDFYSDNMGHNMIHQDVLIENISSDEFIAKIKNNIKLLIKIGKVVGEMTMARNSKSKINENNQSYNKDFQEIYLSYFKLGFRFSIDVHKEIEKRLYRYNNGALYSNEHSIDDKLCEKLIST